MRPNLLLVPALALLLAGSPGATAQSLPSPDDYFTIQNGHLSRNAQRVPIWGSQGISRRQSGGRIFVMTRLGRLIRPCDLMTDDLRCHTS